MLAKVIESLKEATTLQRRTSEACSRICENLQAGAYADLPAEDLRMMCETALEAATTTAALAEDLRRLSNLFWAATPAGKDSHPTDDRARIKRHQQQFESAGTAAAVRKSLTR